MWPHHSGIFFPRVWDPFSEVCLGSSVFLSLHNLGNLSKGRDVAGHASVRAANLIRENPFILQALAFPSLGVGLGGPVCSWLAETSPLTQLPCRDPRASRRKLSLLHLTPDSQE